MGSHAWCVAALAALLGTTVSATAAGKTELERTFARGVYWPWERTQPNADAAGKEFWQFTDDLMGYVHTNLHCNVIWFVNGPSEPARVCDLAAKHELKVLCGAMAHQLVHGLTDVGTLEDKARTVVEELGVKPALGAYVLKDEPRAFEAQAMESVRRVMAAADPSRPSMVVTMTHDTEAYCAGTDFPIICTDIYHFGAPRSPNIPNPASSSQRCYRGAVTAMNTMAARGGKTAWVMPQVFADLWGPWWRDADGNIVLEPGTYWHWRMCTPAEMHWQTWEGVRAGSEGVVWFVLLGAANPWHPDQGPMPEKMQKRIEANKKAKYPLVRERIATGAPSDLLYLGGGPTAQSDAVAEDFALLEKLDPVLTSWQPAQVPVVFADKPGTVATFETTARPDTRYAVVVNDDLQEARALVLEFLPNVTAARNLADGKPIELVPESVGVEGLLNGSVTLAPGMGTVLELTCRKGSQFALFTEDFSAARPTARLDKAERRQEPRGFGMGTTWAVRKTAEADEGEGTVTLHDNRYIRGALHDAARGKTQVFLLAEGNVPKAECLVVNFKDKDGKGGWNKTNEYHRPVAIPPDTVTIELQLRTRNAALTGVRIWRVDLPQDAQ